MATRQSTPRKAEGKSRAEWRKELAHNICAILANPECPTVIYNDLAGAVLDVFNSTPTQRLDTSEAYTLALLEEYAAAKDEGSAR